MTDILDGVADPIPHLALDQQLCFALYRASRSVVRSYAEALKDLGITYPQYLTLLALWADVDRPMGVGELGEQLGLDSGTLTPLLKRLEQRGFLERRRSVEDERRVDVVLTDEGRALRDRAAIVPVQLFPAYGMSLDDAAELRGRLHDLADRLDGA